MIEILNIISGSWPIAAMVIGVAAAITIRRSFKQALDNTAQQNEYRASSAVTVRNHRDD